MTKTVKFNLKCDGNPVRNIKDLRENFNIDDALELFKNGLLIKWLEVRGYTDFFDKVKAITSKHDIDIIIELIKIFDIENNEKNIRESIYALEFKNHKYLLLEKYKLCNYEVAYVINKYHSGYIDLINEIIKSKDDMPKIKACIKEMINSYIDLFRLNYRELFYTLSVNSPMALFAMLMYEEIRSIYLPCNNDYDEKAKSIMAEDKGLIYNEILKISTNNTFYNVPIKDILGENLKIFPPSPRDTDSYWDDIETAGKFMILSIDRGSYVRNFKKCDEKLGADEVNGKFLILDGINYASSHPNYKLQYLEA